MKKSFTAICILTLAACSSTSALDKTMPLMQGKNIQTVLETMGNPSNQYDQGNATMIYVWDNTVRETMPETVKTSSFGVVGTIPLSRTDYVDEARTYETRCTVKMTVIKGIIQSAVYDGFGSACYTYQSKLAKLTGQ